jgi:hypothetical protein
MEAYSGLSNAFSTLEKQLKQERAQQRNTNNNVKQERTNE